MSETKVTQSEYVSASYVAERLGVCRLTVYRMCQTGILPHIRTGATGKIYRIRRDALDAHLAAAPPRDPAPTPSWAWQNGPAAHIPGQTEIPA